MEHGRVAALGRRRAGDVRDDRRLLRVTTGVFQQRETTNETSFLICEMREMASRTTMDLVVEFRFRTAIIAPE